MDVLGFSEGLKALRSFVQPKEKKDSLHEIHEGKNQIFARVLIFVDVSERRFLWHKINYDVV